MEASYSTAASSEEVLFHDGFGDRVLVRDSAGTLHESLQLRPDLSAVPSLEFAINERMKALEHFEHPSFLRVRGVVRVPGRLPRLSILSDYVPGVRLTEVLTAMERQGGPRSAGVPLFLIQEILAAVAALHRDKADVSHGALAPDRVVIADGRVQITDYVLGSAVEQLRFSPERYWKELRVAVPASAGAARFDKRLDVAQVGTIALALLAGRSLRDDEGMGNLGSVLAGLALAQPLQTWLLRTLHMDPRRAYVSAAEAGAELEAAMADAGVRPSPLELRALGVKRGSSTVSARPVVKASAPIVAANEPAARQPAKQDHPRRAHDAAQTRTMYVPGTAVPAFVIPTGFSKTMRGVVTLGVVSAAIAVAFTGAQYVPVPASIFSHTGTLVIESKPQGVPLTVDGQPQGVTPVTLQLPSGRHEVELRGNGKPRIFNVFVSRGAHISQYIEMPSRGRNAQPATPAPVLAEPAHPRLTDVERTRAPIEPAPIAPPGVAAAP